MLKGPYVNCSITALVTANPNVDPGINFDDNLTQKNTVGATHREPNNENLTSLWVSIENLKEKL